MNRKTWPLEFRTVVVFSMLSLTCLPMCSPDATGGESHTIQRAELSAPEDAHQPPANRRAAGPVVLAA